MVAYKTSKVTRYAKERIKILVSSKGYLAEGITLNAGDVIIYYSESALLLVAKQVFAREHRVGQKNDPVTSYTLVVDDDIDFAASIKVTIREAMVALVWIAMGPEEFNETYMAEIEAEKEAALQKQRHNASKKVRKAGKK